MPQSSDSTNTSNEISADNKKPEYRSLRIWPAVTLVAAIFVLWSMTSMLEDATFPMIMLVIMGPVFVSLLVFLWWATFSRANWKERLTGLLAVVAVGFVTAQLLDKSMLGFPIMVSIVPVATAAFAIALILLGRAPPQVRTTVAVLAMTIGFGYWTLIRGEGMWGGDFKTTRNWRWEPTAEDVFLENIATREKTQAGAELPPPGTAEWPGFRGPERNATVAGITLQADWTTNPPKELWRTAVGPGWSSFAIAGRRLFTMEQRGENEAVVCFDTEDGSQLWDYEYPSRFWEAMGGVGPRATPTMAEGNLYSLGADGILLRLDPVSGEKIWQRDLKSDADRKPPIWGFSASPLVVGDKVIVHAGGSGDNGVLAYNIESGERVWSAASGDHSYSSAHLLTMENQDYVAMVSNTGLSLHDPGDGSIVFDHQWQSMGYRTLQPLLFNGLSLLLPSGMGEGTRKIDLSFADETISAKEVWTSVEMEPDFNDFVAWQGNLYGFDRNIFACIDLNSGERRWKRGRFGTGQVMLLSDSGQLLVTSEKGELVLLNATPDKLDEVDRVKVFNGKTWNHPALVGNRLYLRNAEEVACYELAIAASGVARPSSDEPSALPAE